MLVQLLLRHPYFNLPIKFMGKVFAAVAWGIALSPFDLDVKLVFGAIAAVLASLMIAAPWVATDRCASASRLPLYGLIVAGEALFVGTLVFAFLGTFQGHPQTLAMIGCAFGGVLLPLYGAAVIYRDKRDNMSKGPGSTT